MRITKPEKCYVFARNAVRQGHPDLALEAYRRAVDLRARDYETDCEMEHAAVRAIYAYEEALSYARGKRTRATGTWQVVQSQGVVEAVQKRLHSRNRDEVEQVLAELGMEDYTFGAFCNAYPEAFSRAAA
ncbi:MAG: hypothetical protein ACK5HY_12100 [Parahaliea sp.]